MSPGPQPFRRTKSRGPTSREIDVLELIAQGMTNREVAQALHLSEETIKSHVRHLLDKLGALNRAHLVSKGFAAGLLTMPSSDEPITRGSTSHRRSESGSRW